MSYLLICLRNNKEIYVVILDQNSQKPKIFISVCVCIIEKIQNKLITNLFKE